MPKPLKRVSINEATFNKILSSVSCREYCDDLSRYSSGYQDANIVRYSSDALIVSEAVLHYLKLIENRRTWYQYYCVLNSSDIQISEVQPQVNPISAIKIINNIIYKHYTEQEKIDIFLSHECEKGEILHYPIKAERGRIQRYEDCYYYDLNGAYASELMQLFPKCKSEMQELFVNRHNNNNKNKNVFNFYVGCLTINKQKAVNQSLNGRKVRETFPKTREYIIDSVTKKIESALYTIKPHKILYINTDGFIVQSPHVKLKTSEDSGTFKLEYQGDIYTYQDVNYSIFQYGDNIKGNLPIELRKYVDLRAGLVVHYKKIYTDRGVYNYENIRTELIK